MGARGPRSEGVNLSTQGATTSASPGVENPVLSILVVDDEVDLLATYRRLLTRDGFRVVTATSCEGGLAALAREHFALVIADLRLPDGDGLEIVRRASASNAPTPVIVVSGYGRGAEAIGAGAAAFFSKPFQASALAARVRALISTA